MRILLTFLVLIVSTKHSAQNQKFSEQYAKASTATFYSSTVSNPFHELNYAIKLADSAKVLLNPNSVTYLSDSIKIHSLINELNSSKLIAEDNLNYQIPGYSLIVNSRDDLNFIDDAQELLIEFLIQRIFSQADPLQRGLISENTNFFIVNINPYSDILMGVVLDYFSANSDHYAVRPHEITAILGSNGYDRYLTGSLNENDYSLLFNYYKTDKIYNLSLENKGPAINNLYYWGSSLSTINSEDYKLKFQKYFEHFRVDKSHSKKLFYFNLFVCILLLVLFLRLFDVRSYNKIKIELFFQKHLIRNDILFLFIGFIALITSYKIGSLISPPANSFYMETKAMLWVLFQVVGFPIIFMSFLIFGTLKFGKISTLGLENLRKYVLISFSIPVMYVILMNQLIDLELNNNILILLILMLSYVTPSYFIGISLSSFFKSNYTFSHLFFFCFAVTSLYFSHYFVLYQNYLFGFSIGLISSGILLAKSIFSNKKVFLKNIELDEDLDSKLKLSHSFINEGFNYEDYKKELDILFGKSTQKFLFVSGVEGVGKKTFLKDYLDLHKINNFHLDFSNNQNEFESFKNCFIEINKTLELDDTFFDSHVDFNNIYNGIGTVSNLLPLDIPEFLTTNDVDLSVKEIAINFANRIAEKIDNNWCIYTTNFEKASENDKKLFLTFLKLTQSKPKLSSLRFVIIENDSEGLKIEEQITKIFGQSICKVSLFCNDLTISSKSFLNQLPCSNQLKFYIKEKLDDLAHIDQFSIGRLKILLQEMHKDNVLVYKDNKLTLKNKPLARHEFINDLKYLKREFNTLTSEDQLILEVASILGRRFSVNIVSDCLRNDNLDVIYRLEKLEEKKIIQDETNSENIYKFSSNAFYEWIRKDHLNYNSIDKSQKVIEFQNRLLKSVHVNLNSIKNEVLKVLIDEIILSFNSSNHKNEIDNILIDYCVHLSEFSNVKYVGKYLSLFLVRTNLISIQSQLKIIKILDQQIKTYGNFSRLDSFEVRGVTVIDEIISEFTRHNESSIQIQLLEMIFEDVSKRLFNHKNQPDIQISNRLKKSSIFVTQNNLNSDRICFFNLKIDFISKKINGYQYIKEIKEIALSSKLKSDFQFASEIYREISIVYRNSGNYNQMIYCTSQSLNYLDGKEVFKDDLKNSSKDVIELIKTLLTTRLTVEQLSNLSYAINRYCDAFSLKGDHVSVNLLTDYNIVVNKKIKDYRGLVHSYRHKGKSLFFLEKYAESLGVFQEYFNFLSNDIGLGSEILEFDENVDHIIDENHHIFHFENEITPVLEGTLHNCFKLKDYDIFDKMKSFLYERNVIISSKILSNRLYWIDPNITLSELYKPILKNSKLNELSKLIARSFLILSFADGNICDEEIHDSIEYVNAFCLVDNINLNHSSKQFIGDVEDIEGMNVSERKKEFSLICEKIYNDYTIDMYVNFCNSLIKISHIDNEVHKTEIEYINIAKSFLNV